MPKDIPFELIIAILAVVALIIIIVLCRRLKTEKMKKELSAIQVRFNEITSIPLAFKLNKATYISKINEEMAKQVDVYRDKYDVCQKNLEQIKTLIDNLEDDIACRNNKQAKEALLIVKENVADSEKEVADIEAFLDTITQREQVQREYSNSLKDRYREIKQLVSDKMVELSFANEGVDDELKVCENLFSSFEEQIYANDFVKAQENLEEIAAKLERIQKDIESIPHLVHLSKGVIPTMLDEVDLQYTLSRQRMVYLGHMNIESRVRAVNKSLAYSTKAITCAELDGVLDELNANKAELESILKGIETENMAFSSIKRDLEISNDNLKEIDKTYDYIAKVYQSDREKYDLLELTEIFKVKDEKLTAFNNEHEEIAKAIEEMNAPASSLLEKLNVLFDKIAEEKEMVLTFKHKIDKATNDEARAITQVTKFQIVLNEVEVKIAQYRLPAISDTYKDDLVLAHDKVNDIKILLAAIPLDIPLLNEKVQEALDYVYKLYNNVNNVVGMALMVENAIVFGNKYRSTYPEVDSELSKAEFAYLNGEYTQSLAIAISCIERLFPKDGEQKLMEYATGAK